ncbi:polysaccharide biosynthesis C-terminal domain-containing protein [Latilactobacillus curvatus]|uniref:oligosaccharide flippase family protein n=1 Tax=Latilactobacillus curvatus TaxID=28038 RepID=UPI0021131A1C|nr:polysaccharide biosynthesis C-terminal domain-containing protein [Latilactobacillus curvatus]
MAYYRDDKAKTSQIFWEVFLMRMITILVALAAFFIFLGFEKSYHEAYLMQAILIVAAAFDISWFFMGFENFKVTVLRNIIVKLISLACIFIFVRGKGDLTLYIAVLSISQLIGNVTLFPYLKRYISLPNWRELKIWRHFKPSLVLFVPQIATQVYLILNKTMVGKMVSVEAAGFYDNSDKIVKMVLAIVTATGTVMLPRVANTFAKGDHEQVKKYLYQSFDFVSAVSIPIMFGIAAIAPKFATMFFGQAFDAVGPLMMIESLVILFIAWSNVLGVQYLLPTGHNKEFTVSVTVGAIVNIILNVPLIILLGTSGAMIATVISEFSVTCYQIYVVKKELDLNKMMSETWKYLLSGIMMFIVILTMNLRLHFSMVQLIIQVVVGMLVYCGILWLTRPKILEYIKPRR